MKKEVMIYMIPRDHYMTQFFRFRGQPLIKVITGMRRSGKSTLLALFAEALKKEGVPSDHIIAMNLESLAMEEYRDYRKLYRYLKECLQGEPPFYLLLDEVQATEGWEKVVNSLFEEGAADIYLTGSNAKMLSSELSTLLSGRYVEIPVFPLSFQEYLTFLPAERGADREAAFQSYLTYGGLPIVPSLPQDEETIGTVLMGIYNTVLDKDIVQRNGVRDAQLLERVATFLADAIGSPVSTHRISGYLTSQGRKVSGATLDNYLRMLEEAFIFYRAQRYDIKGKALLKTQEKYYSVDLGLRNALLDFHGGDYGHILENVVYLELLRRGYRVRIGKIGSLEVDFIAEKAGIRRYYQVSATILDEATRERELRPLFAVPDQYEKYVLTMDRTFIQDFNGIRNQNIIDFLLA